MAVVRLVEVVSAVVVLRACDVVALVAGAGACGRSSCN